MGSIKAIDKRSLLRNAADNWLVISEREGIIGFFRMKLAALQFRHENRRSYLNQLKVVRKVDYLAQNLGEADNKLFKEDFLEDNDNKKDSGDY